MANFEVNTAELNIDPETGNEKMLTKYYMVNANSFGEAELLTMNYMEYREIIGTVEAVVKSLVSKVDKPTHNYFWKVKITTEEVNEINGKLQKVRYYHLISRDQSDQAVIEARKRFNKTHGTFEFLVEQSSKTPFIDIINY